MMNREAEFGYQAACRAGATLPLDARGPRDNSNSSLESPSPRRLPTAATLR